MWVTDTSTCDWYPQYPGPNLLGFNLLSLSTAVRWLVSAGSWVQETLQSALIKHKQAGLFSLPLTPTQLRALWETRPDVASTDLYLRGSEVIDGCCTFSPKVLFPLGCNACTSYKICESVLGPDPSLWWKLVCSIDDAVATYVLDTMYYSAGSTGFIFQKVLGLCVIQNL